MNRPPEPSDTVHVDAGCISPYYQGQYVAAKVVCVYPSSPHTRANPRSRMILVEVEHENGKRSQHAVPIRRVRRSG